MVDRENDLAAFSELLAMGIVVHNPTRNLEEIEWMLRYICGIVGKPANADEVIEEFLSCESIKKCPIKDISCNMVHGDPCVAFTMPEEDGSYNLYDEDGVFSYVANLSFPDCSELGYCFFEKENGKTHRVG